MRRFCSRLKERFPHMFQDLCLYCEVSDVLGLYKFRLHIRRFVQGLFANVIFDPVGEGVIWHRLCGSWCPHPPRSQPSLPHDVVVCFPSSATKHCYGIGVLFYTTFYTSPPPPLPKLVPTVSERFLYHPLLLVSAKFHPITMCEHFFHPL